MLPQWRSQNKRTFGIHNRAGVHLIFLGWELVLQHCTCRIADMGGDANKNLHDYGKPVIFPIMHFSHHISQLHSTFSLLAALLLRVAR